MNLNRFLKYINYLIGASAFVALIGAYWFAWRPLPETSGAIAAPVSAKVTVVRDELGVPHITAANEDDLYFAQGFATAQDRLFQMELGRRQAAGELAELFGPAALESDLEMRRLRMRRLAQMHARTLPDPERRAIAAYVRGVNHFIETHRGRYPVEFAILQADPAPWTMSDSLLIGLSMFRAMSETWRDEILKRNLLVGGDKNKVEWLMPQANASEAVVGSNAWAISGKRTRTGKPILANDPHLGYSLPVIWHQVHLRVGDLDVAGVTLPGLPGVGIGHNRRIAWGITALDYDQQDLFIEKLNPANGAYPYDGHLEQAVAEREAIRVRGGRTVEVQIPVTRHGPVILTEGGQAYALQWTAAEAGSFSYPMIELNHSRNWDDFRKALSRFAGPGFNFVYADVDGNIGYQAAGHFPVRGSAAGDVPADGASPANEWKSVIPFDKMPSHYNPPSGAIVTANQNPFPRDYPYPVSGNFAPDHRARQIHALLDGRSGWDVESIAGVQKDVYSILAHFLAKQFVAACKAKNVTNPQLSEAVEILSTWNGQMEPDSPAALIVTLAFAHFRKAMVEKAAPGKGSLYDVMVGQAAMERLLRARPEGWFADYDEALVRSLLDGVEEGVRLQGRNPRRWKFGVYNELVVRNPVLGRAPWIGSWFEWRAPMGGAASTVRVSSRRSGQSMRFIADLSDLDKSRIVLVTGESGQILSGHYTDQWKTWLAGANFPMQFGKIQPAATLELTPK